MAGERQIESAAHAVTGNGGDHRGGEALYLVHERLAHMGKRVGRGSRERDDFLQLRSGRKELVIAGDYEGLRIAGEIANLPGEREHAGARQAVGAVIRNHANNGRGVQMFELDEMIGQAISEVEQTTQSKCQLQ